jgi:small GTP-binding protein
MNDSIVAVNIFDLSGDDDFKSVRKQFYIDAIGVLMVYDVNIKTTFESLSKWEKEAENNGLDISKCVVVVVGNKTDQKKRVFYKLEIINNRKLMAKLQKTGLRTEVINISKLLQNQEQM